MTAVLNRALTAAVPFLLTVAAVSAVSARPADEHHRVSVDALTADTRERSAELAALTTDDNDVRRTLLVAARSRRW